MIKVPQDFLKENVTRYRKLIKGEKVDYAPIRLWVDDNWMLEYTGVDKKKFVNSLELQLDVQKKVNERFYDLLDFGVFVDYLDVFYDSEKFNTEFPNALPNKFLARSLDDFDRFYTKKKIKDVPGIRKLIEATNYMNKNLPEYKRACFYLGTWGATDIFSIFRGSDFFTDFYDYPKQVHKIFSYLTERSLELLEFQEKTFGNMNPDSILFDKIDIGEDYCAYMPPDLFDQFVTPYTGQLFKKVKGKALCSLHTDGDFVPSGIGKLKDLGVEELMGFSPNIDIKVFRKALPDMILAGNIHPIKVMIEGTPQDVKQAVRYCFEAANQNQKFVLCTGGAIGAGGKVENIDALIESLYEITKY